VDIGIAVHDYDRRQGTGGYTVELVERLAGRHSVTLYAAGVATPPPNGVRVVRVPAVRLSAYTTILSYPAAFAAVRRRHDAVHAQGWVTGDAEVVTAHIVLAAWRDAAAAHGVRSAPGERLFGAWVTRREGALLRTARAVIAPSGRVEADIARWYGRTEGIRVVPHGCERALVPAPRHEARARLGIPPDGFVALYIGDARKGLDAALAALAAAPGAHLLVVTRTPTPEFRERAAARGVAGRVAWAPPGTSAPDAFGAADVLLHPTIYDSFGLTVAEALALGIPVIVSRAAGVAELLEHGRSAWLMTDAGEAGAALAALAADAPLRARLAEAGRAVAAAWTWERTVRETEAVYETVRAR
jgi:UDP-glucose:(heptosyl)LPS alpha-1,3-glucosyltransferase